MSLVSPIELSLNARLQYAAAASPALLADVIAAGRQRSWPPTRSKRLSQLIRAGAWTDAALALIELELPQWQLRRIVYDDGEWYCALSREREVPGWIDQPVEGHHADLALAILSAFVEAKRDSAPSSRPSVPAAGRNDSQLYEPLCCDSFS